MESGRARESQREPEREPERISIAALWVPSRLRILSSSYQSFVWILSSCQSFLVWSIWRWTKPFTSKLNSIRRYCNVQNQQYPKIYLELSHLPSFGSCLNVISNLKSAARNLFSSLNPNPNHFEPLIRLFVRLGSCNRLILGFTALPLLI